MLLMEKDWKIKEAQNVLQIKNKEKWNNLKN